MVVKHGACFLFDGYARPIAHMLITACELVEEGCFTAVLIACQCKNIGLDKNRTFRNLNQRGGL